ncbi:2-oxo-tetronate isomerase [Nesterenkonia sp. HG001]|uniref:2-oxo-tetronate isomerase n=1 Tax=Nesterenkonia sp. HG001 TaxID=2983207 RepID=UPI002AC669FD|nr:2-oxo-tetronate isomerase [Nesterenkonia sp. HG001]MDZ5077556.1 hydroxypyruvate isomerase family protein [Nesterenkonia sp. HG001]
MTAPQPTRTGDPMPRFAANLSMLFTELPFLDRFQAVADAGFTGVEYLFPYDHEASVVAEARRRAGVEQVLFNMPPGDWAAGERGLATLPGREGEFRAGVETALWYAEALGCRQLHAMAGVPGADAGTPQELRERYVARVRHAAEQAAAHGMRVLIEPINTRDMPGYFLDSVDLARDLIQEIDHPSVALQLDLYHAQVIQGDLTELIRATAGITAHVQIASVPDRHEPDGGELDLTHLLSVLEETGYTGWIGCEYRPAGETQAGLGWLQQVREAHR